jgi:hypothetical protein
MLKLSCLRFFDLLITLLHSFTFFSRNIQKQEKRTKQPWRKKDPKANPSDPKFRKKKKSLIEEVPFRIKTLDFAENFK